MDTLHAVMLRRDTPNASWFGGPRSFAELRDAYAPYGGMAHGDQLAREFAERHGTRLGVFARRIVNGELLAIEHLGAHWLPRAQFEADGDAMDPRLVPVVAELEGVFDAWDVCDWLVRPNPLVFGRVPLDELSRDAASVRNAARVERFISLG